jgi:hypothetical protein
MGLSQSVSSKEGREGLHGKAPPPFGVLQEEYCKSERSEGKVTANHSVVRVCSFLEGIAIPGNTDRGGKK